MEEMVRNPPHCKATSKTAENGFPLLHLALHFEPLSAQHLGNLVVTIFREIDLFFVVAILIQDHEHWVVMLNPLHVEVLPLLVAFFLLQPPTHLSKVV